jgi:hypothetical protein
MLFATAGKDAEVVADRYDFSWDRRCLDRAHAGT